MQPQELDWTNPYHSARTPVFGRNVVATSQPLAAQAGLRTLLRGGNAVDAAVAAAIALTVVEPTMNGVGGDAFALIWDGEALHGLNASGRAPRAWNREMFARYPSMPSIGWDSVTVPGAVSAWVALSQSFGVLPFSELFLPALEYAHEGFAVSPFISRTWAEAAEKYRWSESFVSTFMPAGRAPLPGEMFRCQDLGDTLEEIAGTFGESFYRGRLAAAVARYARDTGGLLSEEDLSSHTADWVEPVATDFGGYRLHEIPPNSQGIAALLALALLRGSGVCDMSPDSPESVDLQLRAMRLAHDEVRARVADAEHMNGTAAFLLSEDRVTQLRRRMDRRPEHGGAAQTASSSGDTVYLTAADATGMMVSFIQSNYFDFGSGLVVPGMGISLHSRAACFSLERGHPNEVDGGKRPFHTLSPAFVSCEGRPVMSFGVMGGHMQPQGHVQTFLRVIAHGQNPQSACDAPRWHVAQDGAVLLEEGFDDSVLRGLAKRGHSVQRVPYGDPVFGGGQFALVLPSGYCVASDPRKDGQAVAF
jgi:gamma-glutamyltranspeptidase/glutathione hydrolase